MNKNQLIRSLAFPVVAVISGILWVMFFWTVAGKIFFNNEICSVIPMICGGIISAFLTVKCKIDTSRYLNMKIIFSIISVVTFTIPAITILCFSSAMTGYIFEYMIISSCILFLAEIIYFIKMRIRIKESVVMILSDVLTGDLVMLIIILFIAMNNI
ncbi:MAG: hypothetical protein K2H28_00300 [Ruminococcus sp.]|nr:hypothetical protein [Ruminococcus sp.]